MESQLSPLNNVYLQRENRYKYAIKNLCIFASSLNDHISLLYRMSNRSKHAVHYTGCRGWYSSSRTGTATYMEIIYYH
jgi:hypothetical protein